MFTALILYLLTNPRPPLGPPPFSNAVAVAVSTHGFNDWPLTWALATPFPDCPLCQEAYDYGRREAPITADFNRDGSIDSSDFYAYLALYWATANGGSQP